MKAYCVHTNSTIFGHLKSHACCVQDKLRGWLQFEAFLVRCGVCLILYMWSYMKEFLGCMVMGENSQISLLKNSLIDFEFGNIPWMTVTLMHLIQIKDNYG